MMKKKKKGKVKSNPFSESKIKRYTVKEVRMWMKKLEENRYKKVYNSDARRVAWMVNNEGVSLDEMPISMKKKWTKAQYGRERYLATEFLKSKSEQLSEGLDLKKLETAIKDFQNKIKKQGRVTNARDEDHLKQLIKVYKQMGGKKIKEEKLTEKIKDKKLQKAIDDLEKSINKFGSHPSVKRNMKIVAGLVIPIRTKLAKMEKQLGEGKLRETIREIIKEQLNEKSFGDIRKIKFYKKDGKKIANIITSKKYKLTTPLYKIKGKDIELHIPKKEYNKAVEFFMKNKLNPRG